jgi:hypothetical protein
VSGQYSQERLTELLGRLPGSKPAAEDDSLLRGLGGGQE